MTGTRLNLLTTTTNGRRRHPGRIRIRPRPGVHPDGASVSSGAAPSAVPMDPRGKRSAMSTANHARGQASESTTGQWMFSVDDHVVEPPDLWSRRLPSKYREEGPHVVTNEDGEQMWVYNGKTKSISEQGARLFSRPGLRDLMDIPMTFDDLRPGCFDPLERVKDMDAAMVQRVGVFPVLSALRRPGVPRGSRQGDRPRLRARLQRLDRRGVARWRPRPIGPARHRPALGHRLGVRGVAALRCGGCPDVHLSGEPVPARPPVNVRQGPLLGSTVPRRR